MTYPEPGIDLHRSRLRFPKLARRHEIRLNTPDRSCRRHYPRDVIPRGPAPGTPGAPDSPVVTILNSAVCFIAAPTAAVTAVSWLLTFTPWARFMPDVFFVPLFFLTFPLFGWSVFILSVVRRPPGTRRQAADPLKDI